MSAEYDHYLIEHIANVKKGWDWLVSHYPELRKKMNGYDMWIFSDHDTSKYSEDEYSAYDKYFYGKNKSFKVVQDFNYAWLHHIHANPHHWQYWILVHDDEPEEALDMPFWYIVEMICDWWSFSWKSGKLDEIFEWYEKHKGMKLSDKTRKIVEDLLDKIRKGIELDSKSESEDSEV